MWTRTSSNYVRAQGFRLGAIQTSSRAETLGKHVMPKSPNAEPPKFLPEPWLRSSKFYAATQGPSFSSFGTRCLSSEVASKSGDAEDDVLDEGFSELEETEGSQEGKNIQSDDETELVSNEDDTENVSSPKEKKAGISDLGLLLRNESKPIAAVLDKHVSEGNTLDESAISEAMYVLRKRKMYAKALKFSEWLEDKKVFEFNEYHYATRVDLIAKVHGFHNAEKYLQKIPESCRGEVTYRTLIANCVLSNNMKKADEIFNKMKQLGFEISAFTCNQMILLYNKNDRKKIGDLLRYMEKENIKADQKTYRLLIDIKGASNDISGMEAVVETMKTEGIELDLTTKTTLAKHYAYFGLKDRAESILKEIEGSKSQIRSVCAAMIGIYANIGKEDGVERIWKLCEPNPRSYEYNAIIEAWGKLKQVEKAEAIIEKLEKQRRLIGWHYTALLRVYANNKMLNKGKDLVKKMAESGFVLGPITWDILVKLFVGAGEVEKADAILHKAATQGKDKQKPLFISYLTIMEYYAAKGDIHNAEKTLHRMKLAGYTGRVRPFQLLIIAYNKSKTPVYGLRERIIAENLPPNKSLASQLAQADPFKKTAVSDLLD